jgi:MinD-like ATPase involved in chromosome partitioning or flagellar assembly
MTIKQVLEGDCTIEDIVLDGPRGIKIIPASLGCRS